MSGFIKRPEIALKNILKNLWYSYVSRRLWETDVRDCLGTKCGYSLEQFNAILYYILPITFIAGNFFCKGDYFTMTSVFLSMGICLVIYDQLSHLMIKCLTNWVVLFYAKEKLNIMRKPNDNVKNNTISPAKSNYFEINRCADSSINKIRRVSCEYVWKEREDFLTVRAVADRQNVLSTNTEISAGKSIDNNPILDVTCIVDKYNGRANKVKYDPTCQDNELKKSVGSVESSALDSAFACTKEASVYNNRCKKEIKDKKCSFFRASYCYLARRPVKKKKGDDMANLVYNDRNGDKYKCAEEKICEINNIIHSDHLWSEYSRLDKFFLFGTATLWIPLALMDGGFRAAEPLLHGEYTERIFTVDFWWLLFFLLLHSLAFWVFFQYFTLGATITDILTRHVTVPIIAKIIEKIM